MTPEQETRIEEFRATYLNLVGFVPPRVAARFESLGATNPELLIAQEHLRNLVMYPKNLDDKTAQLVLFGVLMSKLSDAAALHGLAAARAGASRAELEETAHLAALFSGQSVVNRTAVVLDEIEALARKTSQDPPART